MVYLPMSYLYGVRFTMEENDLILSLREVSRHSAIRCPPITRFQELYPQDYYSIDWPAQRNNVAAVDLYAPHTMILDTLNAILSSYEQCSFPPLRRAAVARAYQLIVWEDENTKYQTLAPVSKMFNLVARAYAEGRDSEAFKMHELRRQDFMWMGEEGLRMCGTNGSQLWDIGFITQALVETGLGSEEQNRESMLKALHWLDEAQNLEDPKWYHEIYRHSSKGAWGFRCALCDVS